MAGGGSDSTAVLGHRPESDHRSPLTTAEPLTFLVPDPLTKPSPLGGQPATLRVPHTTGLQGPPVTTPDHTPRKSVINRHGSEIKTRGPINPPARARLSSVTPPPTTHNPHCSALRVQGRDLTSFLVNIHGPADRPSPPKPMDKRCCLK